MGKTITKNVPKDNKLFFYPSKALIRWPEGKWQCLEKHESERALSKTAPEGRSASKVKEKITHRFVG